jgi:hypothetical protein
VAETQRRQLFLGTADLNGIDLYTWPTKHSIAEHDRAGPFG